LPYSDGPGSLLTARISRRGLLRSALVASGGLSTGALVSCGKDGPPDVTSDLTLAPSPTGQRAGTFDSDGTAIQYEVFGEGRPIVLVHGFAASLDLNWVRTGWVEALTPVRQVVGLDARGHGRSDKPHEPAGYAGDSMADDVVRLMDHLEIEKADLFGYSMGSQISLRLLARHQDRFFSAVLGGVGQFALGRSTGEPGDFGSRVAEALLAEDPSTVADPIARAFRTFAEANNNDLVALAAYMRAAKTPTGEAELGRAAIPVLIVNGEADTLVGSPDGLAAAIPGARVVKIPERDHLTVVPGPRFKGAVVQFLNEVAA